MDGLGKVLIINGCSQGKLPHPAPTRDFYTGQLFHMIRKFSELHEFDQRIVSGKYSLLTMDDLVDPYDMKISTKADVKRVQDKCLYRLVELHKAYDSIIVILGKKYREVIAPILDAKCCVIYEKRAFLNCYADYIVNLHYLICIRFYKKQIITAYKNLVVFRHGRSVHQFCAIF